MNPNILLKLAKEFEQLVKLSYIRKLPNGKYRVYSRKGRNLGTYKSREQAKKRLRQVEYFKHVNKADDQVKDHSIDLSNLDNLSYSAIVRELNKKASKQQIIYFLKSYKLFFDNAVKNEIQDPDKIALKKTLDIFNRKYDVKIDEKLIKNAAIIELGNPRLVADYLASIIKFILMRLSIDKRPAAIHNLKNRFVYLDENEIAAKKLPSSSAIGQSITFVKHVLFNHNAGYIREVLNNLVKIL